MTESIRWYSTTAALTTQEHDYVSVDQALEISRSYYARAANTYASAEEAISETMFGFSMDAKTFIEFCVNDATNISFRFETPRTTGSWLSRLGRSIVQVEKTLQDLASMETEVTAFFSSSPEGMARRLGG